MTPNLSFPKLGWVWFVVLGEVAFLGLQALPLGTVAEPASLAATARQVLTAVPAQRISLQPVLDFQPFGAVPVIVEASAVQAPSTAPEPESAEQPRGLALQGVLLPASGAARVLLSMDGAPAKSYAKGDQLPGGGTLSDVAVDQIWIEIDGQTQALGFVAPTVAATVTTVGTADAADIADDEPTADLAEDPAVEPRVKPATSLHQPDLRHLIPDLSNAAAQQP